MTTQTNKQTNMSFRWDLDSTEGDEVLLIEHIVLAVVVITGTILLLLVAVLLVVYIRHNRKRLRILHRVYGGSGPASQHPYRGGYLSINSSFI